MPASLRSSRSLGIALAKIFILHSANHRPIHGAEIRATLESRGLDHPSATVYPLLQQLEAATFLERHEQTVNGRVRKYYLTTPLGQRALDAACKTLVELRDEITTTGTNRVW